MRTMSNSIDEKLYERLKHIVPSKKVSRFVSIAIDKELTKCQQDLKAEYLAAEQDSTRNKELIEWDQLND